MDSPSAKTRRFSATRIVLNSVQVVNRPAKQLPTKVTAMNEVICPHCASHRPAMEVACNGGWCFACGERLPETVVQDASDLARAQCSVPEAKRCVVAPVPHPVPLASRLGGPGIESTASPDMRERLLARPATAWWKKALFLTVAWPVVLAVLSAILLGIISTSGSNASNQLAAATMIGQGVASLWFFGTIGIWCLMYQRRKT
jgi:hypothetical protein